MAGKHSIYSPSSSGRWFICPGSIRKCAGLPNEDSEAAEEGTDAHELASLCLTLDMDAVDFVGKTLPKGHLVDEEMADLVQYYLDFVRGLPGVHHVESWVDLEAYTGEENGGGTADSIVVNDRLNVTDLKFGRIPVSIEGNTQLRMYAAGVVTDMMVFDPTTPVPKEVALTIVQPRVSSEPQTEVISTKDLILWAERDLTMAVKATQDPNAPLVASEHGCMWCPAKGNCTALAEYAAKGCGVATLDEFTDTFIPPAPSTLTNEELGYILNKASIVTKWLEAVNKEVTTRLQDQGVPGWKLVRGQKGKRQWSEGCDDALIAVLRKNYKLAPETFTKFELLSPTNMLKLPAVKENPDLLAVFITQKEGSLCAAPATDKRPGIEPHALVAAEFETIND